MRYMSIRRLYLLANFGGPRSTEEIFPFLKTLLNDREVIWSNLPSFLHRLLFTYVAKKRAGIIQAEYERIGGKSPIYEDTEKLATLLEDKLKTRFVTFHRYLPSTHAETVEKLKEALFDECVVFPLFPQFSYATTGSIAKFFETALPLSLGRKLRWIFSYATHPAYIQAMQNCIHRFLKQQHLKEEDVFLLFSAHGVPQRFVCSGDVYQKECEASYTALRAYFPKAATLLSYQSKFGRGEWLKPYTSVLSEEVNVWNPAKKPVVFVPLTFTSDHIETLVEVQHLYMPLFEKQGCPVFRCPALNLEEEWVKAIAEIVQTSPLLPNQMLLRPKREMCCALPTGCQC